MCNIYMIKEKTISRPQSGAAFMLYGGSMKPLQVFITSNLQQQIDPDLTGSVLAMLIPLFKLFPFVFFCIGT